MSYELQGTLKEVYPVKTFASGFTKREFVVTISRGADDKYPQHIKMSVIKDKCAILDKIRPGQQLKVSFDLRGSEYQGKYYTDLQAYRIDKGDSNNSGGGRGSDRFDEEPPAGYGQNQGDDIPF
jgi:single-strand DNA-binding protein